MRDTWVLAVVGACILADQAPSTAKLQLAFRPRHYATATAGVLSLFIAACGFNFGSEAYLRAKLAESFPTAAVQFIQKERLQGPLFNTFGWGGYLMWEMPSIPVLVDGRGNVHGQEEVKRISNVWNGARTWDSDEDLAAARLVIAPGGLPLVSPLKLDRRFKQVYEDELSTIFVAAEYGTEQMASVTSASQTKDHAMRKTGINHER